MARLPKFTRRNALKATAGAAVLVGGAYGVQAMLAKPRAKNIITAQRLPIPELLNGTDIDGQKVYNLTMQNGASSFVEGMDTPTSGYNGNILGPSLLMYKGDDVVINVTNNLGEVTTTHWHGLHLPASMDGGPYQPIENGETWKAQFKIMNEAATFFYHPHLFHKTAEQFHRGLSGLFIIKDPQNQPAIPDQYGIDDIPLIVQDRSFYADGTMVYDFDDIGVKGDQFLVNGAVAPTFQAPAQFVRFRVLNASNARIYNFGFSDERRFYQIGTDGGMLEKPVPLTRLLLSPAERAEVLVDFRDQENEQVRLVSYSNELTGITPFWARDGFDTATFDIMTISIGAATVNAITALPETLATIERLQESAVNNSRKISMDFSFLNFSFTFDGRSMDMARIDQTIKLNDTEIWEISNPSPMAHPLHVHDIQFQILSRNGQPPPENERGLKDTILVRQDETVRIIARFGDFANPDIPFMYHCHILEHEDTGMMGQFLVV